MTQFKVDGVYNLETFLFLLGKKVSSFSFDQRPKSYNFFGRHHLIKLLKEAPLDLSYFLYFSGEKDFIIRDLFGELSKEVPHLKNLNLEFNDLNEISFYESFALPYWCHLTQDRELLDFSLPTCFLQGIIISSSHLKELQRRGDETLFFKNYFETLAQKNIKIALSLDEPDFSSKIKPHQYHFISFPISHYVENTYREVNLKLLNNKFDFMKNSFLERQRV